MDFWSIKRVLTCGIRKYEGRKEKLFGGYAYARKNTNLRSSAEYVFERIGRDCFRTEPEARTAAIAKVHRSLASMDRQRRKLEERLEDLEQGGNGVMKKKSGAR